MGDDGLGSKWDNDIMKTSIPMSYLRDYNDLKHFINKVHLSIFPSFLTKKDSYFTLHF